MGQQQIRPDADRPAPSAHMVHVADCRKTCSSTQFGFTVIGMVVRIAADPGVVPTLARLERAASLSVLQGGRSG